MSSETRTIGIIGLGAIGCTLARLLAKGLPHTTILGYDIDPEKTSQCRREAGIKTLGKPHEIIGEAATLLLATPPEAIPKLLKEIAAHTSRHEEKQLLIADTATYKTPILHHYKILPPHVKAAGLHPLFGPGARDPRDHTIAVTPVPGRRGARELAETMEEAGFKTRILDPWRHDLIVSHTIGYSYIIATITTIIIEETGLTQEEIEELGGTTFQLLNLHQKTVLKDLPTTGKHILQAQPTKQTIQKIQQILKQTQENPQQTLEKIKKHKQKTNQQTINKAYQTLYKLIKTIKT